MRITTLFLLSLCFISLNAQDFIWIEGEAFTSKPAALNKADGVESVKGGVGYAAEAWGNDSMMSNGQVLHVNINPKQVDTYMPKGGLIFGYDFEIKKSGEQEVWARIGYEFARSQFHWRLDGGDWQVVEPSTATVNVQPIQTWNELAWLQLTKQNLKNGKHSIEFKHSAHTITHKGKEKTSRILHILDAICIAPAFNPQGKWKPSDDHRSEEDKKAEAYVFPIFDKAGPDARSWTELNGPWQYAAWDERSFPINEETRCQAPQTLPDLEKLRWFALYQPKGREEQLSHEDFTHRYLLKAKLDVPASAKGKGFFLDVQRSSLFVSVFVNGQLAGSTETFHTAWQMDLTAHVKAGEQNELILAIKDPYYSLNPKGDKSAEGLGNRKYWNIPRDFLKRNQGTASRHDYPLCADARSGILEPASFVICGPIYTDDVFVKTSVKNKNIELDIRVKNPSKQAAKLTINNSIIPWNKGNGGESALNLPEQQVDVAAGETKLVNASAQWENPHLWFPDDPFLYWVETTISLNGKVVDTKRTRFGFREWDWSTHMFKLNGIKWPMWADVHYAADPKQHIELSKRNNVNQTRYWRAGGWGYMTRRQTMNYFDETGMLVRSSGTFDGQLANYGGGLREPDMSKEPDKRGRRPLKAKTHFFDNWRKQMTAWIEEERNHPCIYIWSVENEIAYINVNNLGQYREVEPELTKGVEHVMNVDPTRPGMVDGGNCLRDESLPVNGAHYTEFMNNDFRDFPDAAYVRDHFYDKNRPQRGAWRMVPDRPIMKGEVYFANGYSTERFATIGGDKCFIGTGETMEARGLWSKMLSEGYRWAEVSSFHFWLGSAERQYWNSWSPTAVFCKQWNWTWGSEATVTRECRVFNSTQHRDPITVKWSFVVNGKEQAGESKDYSVAPGEAESFMVSFTCPKVNALTNGEFVLTATRKGNMVYREAKPVRILAPHAQAKPTIKKLTVFDPQGSTKAYLKRRGITFTDVPAYNKIPQDADVILIGSNAIAADRSTDPMLLGMAAKGKKVIVLDQQYPLSYKGIAGDLKVTSYTGRFGFSEDLSHPIFSGLSQADFFTWGNDHVMYRNAYRKGTKGGRSLLQCDNNLAYTALFESQPNDGLFILSQLALDKKLASEAVAQQVFNNLLNYAANYTPLRKASTVVMSANDERVKLLSKLQLEHKTGSALDAIKQDGVAIVDATPANLKSLADNKAAVDAFCEKGGWLVLWGLTPEGLASFNTLVDHQHAIRKFEKERVLLNYPTSKFAAGLTLRDVVMDTGKKMYPWMALKTPDQEAIKWVVDHTDIAPFSTFPSPTSLGKPSDDNPGIDHFPRNMVNGFTSADNWAFTYTIIMDRGDSRKFTLKLPKEEELVALKIRPSAIYHPITKMNIYFDDDPTPVVANIPVRENPIVEDIPIPGRKAKTITLEVTEWAERGTKNIVVIDNLWLQVKRDEQYMKNVTSLLNIGALMAYQKGKGGIFLNQLNILGQEVNPDNVNKKAAIVRTTLSNLGAIFSGSKTEVDDAQYTTQALKMADGSFNAYVHQRGKPAWYNGGDIEGIPVGNKTYAGVDFFLSDFSTSPVPSVYMLSGTGATDQSKKVIKNIAVGKKADALFFLHTYHPAVTEIDRWRKRVNQAARRKQNPPANPHCLSYIVHYNDGSKEKIDVLYEEHIGAWDSKSPLPYPQADLGWVGKQSNGKSAAVWVMKWVNPHPSKDIKHIDINAGRRQNGSAAVFAISTGTKVK